MAKEVVEYDGYNILLDDSTGTFALSPTKRYLEAKKKAAKQVLANREQFKQRGRAVVIGEYTAIWERLVDNSLKDEEKIHYNGAIIEAALECMEKLSAGEPVEEAYTTLDVQTDDPADYFGFCLTGAQNLSATIIVSQYHERGEELAKYRDKYVLDPVREKSR